MPPELREAIVQAIRKYLESAASKETKGLLSSGAKAVEKRAGKAVTGVESRALVPTDPIVDANIVPPNALTSGALPVPYTSPVVPPIGASPTGTMGPGMITGDWMTPAAAAGTVGAAMLARQFMNNGQAAVPGSQFLYPSAAGPTTIPQVPPTPVQATAPPAAAPARRGTPQAVTPQTAPRMTTPPTQTAGTSTLPVSQTVPVPQAPTPDAGLSFSGQLGRPEIYGMLGQLAGAIAPGSFGARLGGFASNRAQGVLTNQALQNLLQQNPTLGLSDAAAGTLGPEAVTSLGQQALQYDLGNDQTAVRAFEAESPEQRLVREYLIATAERPSNRTSRVSINVNPEGKTTPPREKYVWVVDDQGNRIRPIGPDLTAESSSGGGGADTAAQVRLNIADARKEAIDQLRIKYKDYLIADPENPGDFVMSPYAPPEAQAAFRRFFHQSVRDRQKIGLIPDNVSILGETVGSATPVQETKKPSFQDIK